MIVALRGQVWRLTTDAIWLHVRDVYYEIFCSASTIAEVSHKYGLQQKDVLLYTYLQVREDAQVLFGFLTLEERELFLNLIKANGIGPKSAIQILSGATVTQIMNWIEAGDVSALARLPKLGKKSAEQLVLSLKGKLTKSVPLGEMVNVGNAYSSLNGQVRSALLNLGFKDEAVDHILQKMPEGLDIQEGIRWALRELSTW